MKIKNLKLIHINNNKWSLLTSISIWLLDNIISNTLSINDIMIEMIKESALLYLNNEKTIIKEYKISDDLKSYNDIHKARKNNIKVMSLFLSQINRDNSNEILEIMITNDYTNSLFWEILPILIGITYNITIQIYNSNIKHKEESDFIITYVNKSKSISSTKSYNLQRNNIILMYLDYKDQYLLLQELDYKLYTISNKHLGKIKADGSCCKQLLENIQIIGEKKRGYKVYAISMFCFEQINEIEISRKMHIKCIQDYFSK